MTFLHPRFLRVLVTLLVAGLVACSPGADVAAQIGGADVTHAQLRIRADLLSFLGGLNQQPCGSVVPGSGETQQAACSRFALGSLVQSALVASYVRSRSLAVDPQEVTGAIDGLYASVGAEAIDQGLAGAGLTRADLEALAGDLLLIQQVRSAVAEERLGDGRLRGEYEDRLLQFTTVRAQHILVATRQEAEDVYDQVTAPGATEEDFMSLARQVSTDTGSARQGGALGAQPASGFVPEFASAVVALEPGEISRPVQSQSGWHVIRLIGSTRLPFDEVKGQLLQELTGPEFTAWLQERASSISVEVNPRYGRFNVRTLQVDPVRSTDPQADQSPSSSTGAVAPAQPTQP